MKTRHTAAADPCAEAHRHAYNAAFEELGLAWHWDAATYARLQSDSTSAVRIYLLTEQAHLLRAYEESFLVEAIEAAKARCYESMARNPARHAPWAIWAGGTPARLAA
ncbi:MAG: hypothetical protein HYX47_16325 [Burkholderiales bacterium]|nr:hypothetical protein [Burkholderiales bacterium]